MKRKPEPMVRESIKSILPDRVVQWAHRVRGRSESWAEVLVDRFEQEEVAARPPGREEDTRPLALFWMPLLRWPQVFTLELFWAAAMKMRRWRVLFLLCDGILPYCWYESITGEKKCDQCEILNRVFMRAGEFTFITFSGLIGKDRVQSELATIAESDFAHLRETRMNGYPIGLKTYHDLCYRYKTEVSDVSGETLETFRLMYGTNLLTYQIAREMIKNHSPEVAVIFNGNSIHSHSAYFACRESGIRPFTWEDYGIYADGFVFSQDEPANFTYIDEGIWQRSRQTALTTRQRKRVADFQKRWMRGSVVDVVYHPRPEKNREYIADILGLDSEKPTFVAFPNLIWETSCLGRDFGFSGLLDWLFSLIEWFSGHRAEGQLVIRIHPSESRALPEWYLTSEGVHRRIRERFGSNLPGNIIVVPSDSHLFSYTLADMADAVGVYTSSLGYELALMGRRVWVAGETHYRGHGFSLDIRDRDHLYNLLESHPWEEGLRPEEIDLAFRYVYLRYFRQIARIPFLSREKTQYKKKPFFRNLRFLDPGNVNTVTVLAERIMDGEPVIDVPVSKPHQLGRFRRR